MGRGLGVREKMTVKGKMRLAMRTWKKIQTKMRIEMRMKMGMKRKTTTQKKLLKLFPQPNTAGIFDSMASTQQSSAWKQFSSMWHDP